MSKVFGLTERYKPLVTTQTQTIVSYDRQTVDDKNSTWQEIVFYHKREGKPDLARIKSAIFADINRQTDERILSGFVWEGKPVWLSQENEFNFKAAYDIAVQTDGANLPLKFKLGEDADGVPIYHTFRSLNVLQDFYTQAIAYIQQCLTDGWNKKDGFDWTPYVIPE